MNDTFDNPFSATRAADYTDEQINDYWVDLGDGGGFTELFKPRSEMPMLILGGKGSGKTHVMRYLSFPLQKIRHARNLLEGFAGDGYLGIYMRCGGLNSSRFREKGQSEVAWEAVFAYYMEIWLAQMVTEICAETLVSYQASPVPEEELVREAAAFIKDAPCKESASLRHLLARLKDIQVELDDAINNSALTRSLNVEIKTTPGSLIYGLPALFSKRIPALAHCKWVYLFDEFENFTASQQKFVNTLIREKVPPCSFKVGSRLYGVATSATYCAGEENKEGSEYESLPLDVRLRNDEGRYGRFAKQLVAKRLVSRGAAGIGNASLSQIESMLGTAFEAPNTEGLAEKETDFVLRKYAGRERPYFRTLRQVLEKGVAARATPGLETAEGIPAIIARLKCDPYPLLEKLNCFILYQRWSVRDLLPETADTICRECNAYAEGTERGGPYKDKLLHFKYDLLAQLNRECDQKQVYAGWETLVDLSWGNPRHLLILLKHIIGWATFKGERAFGPSPISIAAQVAGVREASDWFFKDAIRTGNDGPLVEDAIGRLGTLFRTIRYSHKPSECSLCTFSYDPAATSEVTRRLVDLAEKWSLLVYVEGGQRDRNSERVDVKLQLNRMLAPLWDLPANRRGALALTGPEVNAIFDPAFTVAFTANLKVREARMTAPFFGSRVPRPTTAESAQALLPGMDDE
jgi:hypothetical protein